MIPQNLLLPLKPLSLSRAWQGRRFATKEYKQWTTAALWLLKGARRAVEGPLAVTVVFYLKHVATSDLDNFTKSLLDVLTKAGVWHDDRLIYQLTLEKKKSDDERIEIAIEPYREESSEVVKIPATVS